MNVNVIKPVTSNTFRKMKKNNEKITMLTAYDFSTAKYIDECGVDSILIGDSLGMTILGYDTTINVTVEDMVTFTKAVSNGVKRALVISDMPFLSCNVSLEQTVINAGKLIQAGAKAVKLEGASDFILKEVNHLTQSGINVVGHLGFTPQYINTIGGYFVQGKSYENTIKLLEAAKKLEENGAFAIVFEMVPAESAKYITENLKQYANLKEIMKSAIDKYNKDVKSGLFPQAEHSFNLTDEEKLKLEHNYSK